MEKSKKHLSLYILVMNSKFVIYGRLDGLNEYTKSNRTNRYKGNSDKKHNEFIVSAFIRQAKLDRVTSYPITLKITWYEKDKRRDIDNITFATKFIQDSLVKCGVLVNDSQKYINKIVHDVRVDKNNPRIEVEIVET